MKIQFFAFRRSLSADNQDLVDEPGALLDIPGPTRAPRARTGKTSAMKRAAFYARVSMADQNRKTKTRISGNSLRNVAWK